MASEFKHAAVVSEFRHRRVQWYQNFYMRSAVVTEFRRHGGRVVEIQVCVTVIPKTTNQQRADVQHLHPILIKFELRLVLIYCL
jgi:hypothetical protein